MIVRTTYGRSYGSVEGILVVDIMFTVNAISWVSHLLHRAIALDAATALDWAQRWLH
jgi:hypothetical protein